MSSPQVLNVTVPSEGLSYRIRLLQEDNPDVVSLVLDQLPIESTLGHVVVSGEAIWLPTRIVHLGRNNMVERTPGAVYLYAPGQTICMTYGKITESAKVNKFGEVFEEDLPILQKLGGIVWDKTIAKPRRQTVEIKIERAA